MTELGKEPLFERRTCSECGKRRLCWLLVPPEATSTDEARWLCMGGRTDFGCSIGPIFRGDYRMVREDGSFREED